MKQLAKLPRHVRWVVPTGVLAAVGGVLAASTIAAAAAAAPSLPPRTAAQLLAAAEAKGSVPPLTGTVVETAALGLPALPSAPGASVLPSLLAGSNTMHVWYSDQSHFRISVPGSMSESDLVRNGSRGWLWDSSSDQVTELALPAGAQAPAAASIPLTPQQAAEQALAKAGPSTVVRVDSNATVAGQAAYQLVLKPKSPSSLIGEVRIAIDGANDVPLRVQVFAKRAASPALQVGYTAVSFGQPAASNFTFTPPAEATIIGAKTGAGGKGAGPAQGNGAADGSSVIGSGWLAVLSLPESAVSGLTGGPSGTKLGPLTGSQRAAAPSGSRRRGARPGHGLDLRRLAQLGQAGQRALGQRSPAANRHPVGAVHQRQPRADGGGQPGRPLSGRRPARPAADGGMAARGRPGDVPVIGSRAPGEALDAARPVTGRATRPQVTGRAGPAALAVTSSGLSKRFRSGQVAVDRIDLAVPRGSVYGFLGPNGSGKTTTIRMLLGLVFPTSGSAAVLGAALPGGAAAVLPRVGSLIEGPACYAFLNGRDNLLRYDAADRTADGETAAARVDQALDRVGLANAANKKYRHYSLGMKQRLAIATALLRPRELIVLDEPTNGLDPQGTREVRALIRSIAADGSTVFLSSHLLAEVEQVCSHVGVMRTGALVFQGSLAELRGTGATRIRVETGPSRWRRERCWSGWV